MNPTKASFESIEPSVGSSFSYTSFIPSTNNKAHLWHYHPEIELVFVNGGSGKRQIGSHISYYKNGDLILIGSNLPHCGFTNQDTGNKTETVIHMRPNFLGNDFLSLTETKGIATLFEKAKSGLAFGPETMALVGPRLEKMANLWPFERLMALLGILREMEQASDGKILNAAGFAVEMQPQDSERISIIFNFIKDHFHEEIRLSQVADMANMTVPAFCRYFKKATHKTFTHFVNEYRMVHVCKLLSESPISIANASYEGGFNNFSHFNKLFKQFTGKSASQYRKEIKTVVR